MTKKPKKSIRDPDMPIKTTKDISKRNDSKRKIMKEPSLKGADKKAAKKISHLKVKNTPAQKKATKNAAKILKKVKANKETTKVADVGRPSILTEPLIGKVSALIMAGAYIETACAAVGFSKGLYYEWLKLGKKREDIRASIDLSIKGARRDQLQKDLSMIAPIYEQFSIAIQKAIVDAELRDITRIDQAASRSWQAAAWKLERKHPTRWMRRTGIEHEGKVDTSGPSDIERTRAVVLEIMKDPKALELAEELIERMK